MDHVPRPIDSTVSNIEVPLLDPLPYTLGTFDHYWCRIGYQDDKSTLLTNLADDSRPGLALSYTPHEYARMTQSWLYFGLLSELTGKALDCGSFSRLNDDGLAHVCSEKILSVLAIAKGAVPLRTRKILGITRGALFQLNSLASTLAQGRNNSLPVILLSVAVLASSLDPQTDFNYTEQTFVSTRLLHDYMHRAGWCPVDIRKVLNMQRADVTYFLARLPRRYRNGVSHRLCTASSCQPNGVQEGMKLPKHVKDSCKCSPVGVNQDRLRKFIRSGQIPVVHLQLDRATQEVRLGLRSAQAGSRYIAVSHVWADGLGNPDSNSLPRCQLLRLQKLVDSVSSSRASTSDPGFITRSDLSSKHNPFWLDTLCIPLKRKELQSTNTTSPQDINSQVQDSLGDEDLLKRAINMMGAVYAGAKHTLVLDKEMLEFNAASQACRDTLGHVLCSTWASRCWTLQEGALGRNCFFEFKDGLYNPLAKDSSNIWDRFLSAAGGTLHGYGHKTKPIYNSKRGRTILAGSRSSSGHNESAAPADAPSYDVEFYLGQILRRVLRGDGPRDLSQSWMSLLDRSTSIPGDLYLILANLLDFNSYELANIDAISDKIKAIVWSSSSLPLSLLFNRGQKHENTGDHLDRWTPSSIQVDSLRPLPLLQVHDGLLRARTSERESQALTDSSNCLQPCLLLDPIRFQGRQQIFVRTERLCLEVEAHRDLQDNFQLNTNRFVATMVIPEADIRHCAGSIRGACLHVFERKSGIVPGDPTTFTVMYDCPVTVKCSAQISEQLLPYENTSDTSIADLVLSYSIEVKCELFPNENLLSRRRYPRLGFFGLGVCVVVPLFGGMHLSAYLLQATAMSRGEYPISPFPITGYLTGVAVAWALGLTIVTIIIPPGFLVADIIWFVLLRDQIKTGSISPIVVASLVLSCLKYVVPYLFIPIMNATWQWWLSAFNADKSRRTTSNFLRMMSMSLDDDYGRSFKDTLAAALGLRQPSSAHSSRSDPESCVTDIRRSEHID